jgi:hypothetical protein
MRQGYLPVTLPYANLDFLEDMNRPSLIRIDHQNPRIFVLDFIQSCIPLGCVIIESPLNHPGARCFGHLNRSVAAVRIINHNIIRPTNGLKTAGKIGFFVES